MGVYQVTEAENSILLGFLPETCLAADGNWLATSPERFHLSCGAWGATEQEAVDAWLVAAQRMLDILDNG